MFHLWFALLGGSFIFLDMSPSILFFVFPFFWVLWFIHDWQGFIILLYSYANVMQQPNNSSCELFTIAYATHITFGLNQEQFIYHVPRVRSHLHKNINNETISPFLKYSHSNTL
jgi:hypothetical protein